MLAADKASRSCELVFFMLEPDFTVYFSVWNMVIEVPKWYMSPYISPMKVIGMSGKKCKMSTAAQVPLPKR